MPTSGSFSTEPARILPARRVCLLPIATVGGEAKRPAMAVADERRSMRTTSVVRGGLPPDLHPRGNNWYEAAHSLCAHAQHRYRSCRRSSVTWQQVDDAAKYTRHKTGVAVEMEVAETCGRRRRQSRATISASSPPSTASPSTSTASAASRAMPFAQLVFRSMVSHTVCARRGRDYWPMLKQLLITSQGIQRRSG